MQVAKTRPSRLKKLAIYGGSFFLINNFIIGGQSKANMYAIFKGTTNAAVAFPCVGLCVYDYITSLRPHTYPSQEYMDARSECHKRAAARILFLATHCGGVYFKAGQYIGTLEKIAPKEYCEKLKRLQD